MVFYVGEITALVSLDIHKAVDSLSHSTLLRSLDQQFQPAHTCSIIRQIISDRSTYVRHGSTRSAQSFSPSRGVTQGSPLSSTIFNLYLSQAPEPSLTTVKQYFYADDITLTSLATTPVDAWNSLLPHLQLPQLPRYIFWWHYFHITVSYHCNSVGSGRFRQTHGSGCVHLSLHINVSHIMKKKNF